MRQEKSYGIIPVRKVANGWQVALLFHREGSYWGFPKGHPDPGETFRETAFRELMEETQLKVERLLSEKSFQECYTFWREEKEIEKEVLYFLAEVTGGLEIDGEEIEEGKWVDLAVAESAITYPGSQQILREARQELEKRL